VSELCSPAEAKLVGRPAPDFELPESSGEPFRLHHLLRDGPVVLLFYPSDWGWVCNSEMKGFMELREEFESAGVRLIGISTNSTISHCAWKEMLGIPFPLLSDFDGQVCRRYSLLEEDNFNKGRPKRAVVTIDRDGTIAHAWIGENEWVEPDYDHILATVKSIAERGGTARTGSGTLGTVDVQAAERSLRQT
jgi:peroxiredoxin